MTVLHEIVSCANNILEAVGPVPNHIDKLTTTTRLPVLPYVGLSEVASGVALTRLDPDVTARLSRLVENRMASTRSKLTQRYRQAVGQMYSPLQVGLKDVDIEDHLLRYCELAYARCIAGAREAINRLLLSESRGGITSARGGFGDHNLLILETAFKHTTAPLSAEIDAISKLTSLEPHQVRTWFQNKRNRGNKNSKKLTTLRTASASHLPSNHLSQVDGRRVASLPSRKYVPAQPTSNRPTRGLPNRNGRLANSNSKTQSQVTGGVPLSRTFSQGSEGSDSTNCSYSSIPANGGFQPFTYPSSAPSVGAGEQPMFSLDPLILAQYGPSQNQYAPGGEGQEQGQGYSNFTFDPTSFTQNDNPYNPDLELNLQLPPGQGDEFESYLNFNIDSLAPPTDDLASDLAAQIQAALRPADSSFNNLTLAPSVSLSPSSQGSPYSDLSHGWFSEMTEEEVESMELLKVYLDEMGMGMGAGLEGESPIEKTLDMGLGAEQFQGVEIDGMEGVMGGSRSESPETVASIALRSDGGLNSGRQSPQPISESSASTSNEIGMGGPSTITPNSMVDPRSVSIPISSSACTSTTSTPPIEGDLSFIFDFEQVSNQPLPVQHSQQEMDMDMDMGGNKGGERWMMGVLPFDMADQVMGTA